MSHEHESWQKWYQTCVLFLLWFVILLFLLCTVDTAVRCCDPRRALIVTADVMVCCSSCSFSLHIFTLCHVSSVQAYTQYVSIIITYIGMSHDPNATDNGRESVCSNLSHPNQDLSRITVSCLMHWIFFKPDASEWLVCVKVAEYPIQCFASRSPLTNSTWVVIIVWRIKLLNVSVLYCVLQLCQVMSTLVWQVYADLLV